MSRMRKVLLGFAAALIAAGASPAAGASTFVHAGLDDLVAENETIVAAGTTNQPTAAELQRLQGSWEGVLGGQEAAGKISITITGNSLHFQGLRPDQWYETTFTLPAGTDPQQLHATIKDCPHPDAIGKVVFAIFKIEDGTLTLAGIEASAVVPPKTFDEGQGFEDNPFFRYDLKKIHPQEGR